MSSSITRMCAMFLLAVCSFLPYSGHALTRLTFKDGGQSPIVFEADDLGNLAILTAPIPGKFFYENAKRRLIFQLSGEQEYYYLNIDSVLGTLAIIRKEDTQDPNSIQGDVVPWRISMNRVSCGFVQGSVEMSKDLPLNLTHFADISTAMAYLMGAPIKDLGCAQFAVTVSSGRLVGFPLYFAGREDVVSLESEELIRYGKKVDMPQGAQPLPLPKLTEIWFRSMPESMLTAYRAMPQNSDLKNMARPSQIIERIHSISGNVSLVDWRKGEFLARLVQHTPFRPVSVVEPLLAAFFPDVYHREDEVKEQEKKAQPDAELPMKTVKHEPTRMVNTSGFAAADAVVNEKNGTDKEAVDTKPTGREMFSMP